MRLALPDLVSNSYFPAIAAIEGGFARQEGLDIEYELVFPVTESMRGLRDGRYDFVAGSAHSTLTAFTGWTGAKLLAALGQHMYWCLVIRSDIDAERGDVSALKGLRIGAAPGVDLGLKGLLAAAGLDPERDRIRIAPVPGTDKRGVSFGVTAAESLEAGQIDGFWANAMGTRVAEERGVGKLLVDVRRETGDVAYRDYTFASLVATERLVEQQPDAAMAMVKAIVKAHKALSRDTALAESIGRRVFPSFEAGLIGSLIAGDLPYYDSRIHAHAVASMNGFAKSVGLLDDVSVPYETIVATEFASLWSAADR